MTVSVKNLRETADYMKRLTGAEPAWLRSAADEIERLRRTLEEIAELGDIRADEAGMIARRALDEAVGSPPETNR